MSPRYTWNKWTFIFEITEVPKSVWNIFYIQLCVFSQYLENSQYSTITSLILYVLLSVHSCMFNSVEQVLSNGKTSDFYLVGTPLKSIGNTNYLNRFFMVLLTSTSKYQNSTLKLVHDHFLAYPFHFIIQCCLIIWCCDAV